VAEIEKKTDNWVWKKISKFIIFIFFLDGAKCDF
jgi:hypothetical protein